MKTFGAPSPEPPVDILLALNTALIEAEEAALLARACYWTGGRAVSGPLRTLVREVMTECDRSWEHVAAQIAALGGARPHAKSTQRDTPSRQFGDKRDAVISALLEKEEALTETFAHCAALAASDGDTSTYELARQQKRRHESFVEHLRAHLV